MKRQRVRIATAVMAAAGIAGCFSDPTSSLRNGPAALVLSRSAAIVPVSDSVLVEANVVDAQGNILPASGAVWTSDSPTIADVALAAQQLPADGSTRAYIKGIAVSGGVTTVRVTVRGVSDSVRVTALPTVVFPAGITAVTGTTIADTTALGVAFTAGDTLTITAPAGFVFDAASSAVLLGGQGTDLLARSATSITVMVFSGYQGPATVTNVTWLSGNAAIGDIALASLNTTENVSVARARFRGTASVSGGFLMTLTPGPGTVFRTTAPVSGVRFGGDAASIVSSSPTQLVVTSPQNYTGPIKVTNVSLGAVTLDSLTSVANITIQRATVPGATVKAGTNQLDTITINMNAGATLNAATSNVVSGGLNAFVLSRTTAQIVVVPQAPGAVSVTNITFGGFTFTSMPTASDTVGPGTGDVNEPANNLMTTAPTLAATTSFQTIYRVVTTSDVDDFFRIVLAAPAIIEAELRFRGTGASANNPDLDAFVVRDVNGNNVLNAADVCDEFGGTFVEADCTGATGAQPEFEITQVLPAGTYFIYVNNFDAHGITVPITYELRYRIQ